MIRAASCGAAAKPTTLEVSRRTGRSTSHCCQFFAGTTADLITQDTANYSANYSTGDFMLVLNRGGFGNFFGGALFVWFA